MLEAYSFAVLLELVEVNGANHWVRAFTRSTKLEKKKAGANLLFKNSHQSATVSTGDPPAFSFTGSSGNLFEQHQ